VLGAQRRVIDVAARDLVEGLIEATVDHQHLLGFELGKVDRLVEQMLVRHRLAAAHAGVGRNNELRFGIVDARRQRAGGEAAEHHGVDGADARAGEDGEGRFGDHRHVDQHAVALLHAERLHDRRHAHHLGLQFGETVDFLLVGFGRDEDQRAVIGAFGGMAVHRIVAEIGLATREPLDERRLAVVTNGLRRRLPVNQLRLLAPEPIAIFDGATVKIRILTHFHFPSYDCFKAECAR